MSISNYLCHVVGEAPDHARRLHPSTQRRITAFAIAIHIPVALWAVTGYVIGSRVFGLDHATGALIALFCSLLIYLVERVVLATPKAWYMNICRILIGLVISVLGASAVDLVIFEREVTQQLKAVGESKITTEFDRDIAQQRQILTQKKTDWMKAQEAANCEANGTCGSRLRSVGPVYQQLARQADLLREDYVEAESRLALSAKARTQALADWRTSPKALEEAGLLSRVEALHQYTVSNTSALVAWILFFWLVLFFELMVVLAKLVFGETVDDQLDRIREQLSYQKATAYLEGFTSPLSGARNLLESSC